MPNPLPKPNPPATRDDDWVAVVVALAALGTVLGWALVRSGWFQDAQTMSQDSRLQVGEDVAEPTNRPLRKTRLGFEREERDETGLDPSLEYPREVELFGQPLSVLSLPEPEAVATALRYASQLLPVSVSPRQQSLVVPEPRLPATEETTERLVNPLRPPLTFSDLPAAHWAKPHIDALTAREIVLGFPDGTFGPDQALTRAEFAAQLVQAFDLSAPANGQSTFNDLPPEYWATDVIQNVVMTGFMKGYPDALFQPEQTVSRAQVMAAIATGLQLQPPADSAALLAAYQDSAEIPIWAQDSIGAVISTNLVTGEPDQGELRPNQPATRAEVATLLYRALVYLGKVSPVD